jgi:stearoyl-CoA desaturase (delta-9 desaturase)
MLVTVAFAASFYFIPEALGYSGVHALLWGFFVQQVFLWHGTFTINSFTHIWGRRRYATTDDSKNSFLFAIITLGEGWHNNHHYYQRSTAQGFFWWEIDITYYILRGLQAVRLVKGVGRPPKHVRDSYKDQSQDQPVESAPAIVDDAKTDDDVPKAA